MENSCTKIQVLVRMVLKTRLRHKAQIGAAFLDEKDSDVPVLVGREVRSHLSDHCREPLLNVLPKTSLIPISLLLPALICVLVGEVLAGRASGGAD